MQPWTHRLATVVVTALFALAAGSLTLGTASAAIEGYAEGDTATGTCADVTNAITDNNARATCDDGEYVTLTGFDITDVVPLGAEDISFTVRVAARVTNNDGTDVAQVSLSWNGGTNFTGATPTASINAEPGSSDSVVTAPSGGACSNFGRTWSFAELVNGTFMVRVTADPSSGAQDIEIDDVDVRPCWAGRDILSAQVNGTSAVDVDPAESVTVRVDVLHTDVPGLSSSSDNDWESTSWSLGATAECVNHADFTDTDTDFVNFSAQAPNANGVYDLILTAFEDDSCTSGASELFVLDDAVDTTSGTPVPTGEHAFVEGNSGTGTCANPVYAVVNDNSRAICDDGEYVVLSGFDLDQLVPDNAEDISITVRVAARTSDNDGDDLARASLSWNGGSSYTAQILTASIEAESGDDSVVYAPTDASCSLFGRTWSRAELTDANFRVRVEADPNDANEQISINDVDVRVCWAGRFVDRIRVDGASSTDVNPGDNVEVTVDVLHVDAPGVSAAADNDWQSTRWFLGAGSACVNHADFLDSDLDTVNFSIPAPNSEGVFDLTVVAYQDDSCATAPSAPAVLDDAVDTRFGPVDGPTVVCDDIPEDSKFLWLLWHGTPGHWRNFERGHIPPGLLKSFFGQHRGWDWDDWEGEWDDFDCDDLEQLLEKWWDDDDDHHHRGRRHHDDEDDD